MDIERRQTEALSQKPIHPYTALQQRHQHRRAPHDDAPAAVLHQRSVANQLDGVAQTLLGL